MQWIKERGQRKDEKIKKFGTKAYAKEGKLVSRPAVCKTRVLWRSPIVNLVYEGLDNQLSLCGLLFNKAITYRERRPSFEVPHQERGHCFPSKTCKCPGSDQWFDAQKSFQVCINHSTDSDK